MPWAILLVVAGLVLVFATSYVTLGWILFAIGVGLFVIPLIILAMAGLFISKHTKKEYKKFGSW